MTDLRDVPFESKPALRSAAPSVKATPAVAGGMSPGQNFTYEREALDLLYEAGVISFAEFDEGLVTLELRAGELSRQLCIGCRKRHADVLWHCSTCRNGGAS